MTAPVQARNRIGGSAAASSGGTFERRDPSDDRGVVSVAPESTDDDVRAAVDAAAAAAPAWGATTAFARADLLEGAAAALAARVDDVALLLSREEGKPVGDARNETGRAVRNLRAFAGEALRLRGATFPPDEPGVSVRTAVGPIGVVGVITPGHFPLALSRRKLAPALAAGNTVGWQP